jgi:hypothetical protein
METDTDLLIIGAGPFGLAVAAYAKHSRLEHPLVGTPMESWKENMPKGMYLPEAEFHKNHDASGSQIDCASSQANTASSAL